jgi:hypothetical protein
LTGELREHPRLSRLCRYIGWKRVA